MVNLCPSRCVDQMNDRRTYLGGANNDGVIFKLTPSGSETVLYSFKGGTTAGSHPSDNVIQASDGNFYGTTSLGGASGNGVVFKITPSGTESVLHSFKGGTTDGATPYGGLIHATDGNFYVMTLGGGTSSADVIFKITPGGAETVLYSFKCRRQIHVIARTPRGNVGAIQHGAARTPV